MLFRSDRIAPFKRLAVDAAAQIAKGRTGFGMLIDGTYGREALFRAADHDFWIGRPVEDPGSRPLDFEGGGSLAAKLIEKSEVGRMALGSVNSIDEKSAAFSFLARENPAQRRRVAYVHAHHTSSAPGGGLSGSL